MFKWIKRWWFNRIDDKLNIGERIILPKPDMIYPPPSAYEVKQITEEYNLTQVFGAKNHCGIYQSFKKLT